MRSAGQSSKLLVKFIMNNSLPAAGHSYSPGQIHLIFWALISESEQENKSPLHGD